MDTFTDRLYRETRDLHAVVDRHPFIEKMRTSRKDAVEYVLFNQACISEIQQTLILENAALQRTLHRDISAMEPKKSGYLLNILQVCRLFPLEHAYMFYIGLLSGGRLLKKYIPTEHHSLFTFEGDTKSVILEFKQLLNSTVTDDDHQRRFIDRVNLSYTWIAKCFDHLV